MTGQRKMQGQKQGKRQKVNDRAKENVEAWAKIMAKATAEVSNACIDNLGPLKQILIVENWHVYANRRVDASMWLLVVAYTQLDIYQGNSFCSFDIHFRA